MMDDLFQMPEQYTPTLEEIKEVKNKHGRIPTETLRRWGVKWPLEKGWYERLTARASVQSRQQRLNEYKK